MARDFYRIPEEMRKYPQWVCWRYEDRQGMKPTKVPYNPRTGKMSSVTDPNTWVTYDEAVAAATAAGTSYDGIGFVLTELDPYVIIDLDKPTSQVEIDLQMQIFNEMDSYSERSPSGEGLHIIVKAQVAQGRRRSNVEIYHKERYMTMTGDVYHDRPIMERNALVGSLWTAMGAGAGGGVYTIDNKPQTESDEQVIMQALSASNGLKFKELHEGRWEALYPSQSEADYAYIDIIVFYTQNVEQILRLFWNCPLGQRAKAQRKDYVMRMVLRAFDRMLPPINLIQVKEKMDAAIAEQKSKPEQPTTVLGIELRPITRPPGLFGDIMDFVYESSWLQVQEVALASAIGMMSGICGRPYNVSGTGLNMYTLLLAKTGRGKEAVGGGISKLMKYITQVLPDSEAVLAATNFIGPAEISSGQAILRRLADPNKRCFVSVVGEFGIKMQQLAHPRASASELTLKKVLLDLYNKSGATDVFGGSEYAEKDKNIALIPSPAVSILAESTPSTFYSAIDEKLIKDGLLPRFLVIEYNGPRMYDNENSVNVVPSPQLISGLVELCKYSLDLQKRGRVVQVDATPEAQEFLRTLSRAITDLINTTESDAVAELWNRAHIKTMKLASKVAIGLNMCFPTIDLPTAQWAFNIVGHDIHNTTGRFVRGEVGQDTNQVNQVNEVIKVTNEYLKKGYSKIAKYKVSQVMHDSKVIIPHFYYSRRLLGVAAFMKDPKGAKEALARTEQMLIDDGDLRVAGQKELEKYDFNGKAFVIVNPARFLGEQ